jgi:hypothetical protein
LAIGPTLRWLNQQIRASIIAIAHIGRSTPAQLRQMTPAANPLLTAATPDEVATSVAEPAVGDYSN